MHEYTQQKTKTDGRHRRAGGCVGWLGDIVGMTGGALRELKLFLDVVHQRQREGGIDRVVFF